MKPFPMSTLPKQGPRDVELAVVGISTQDSYLSAQTKEQWQKGGSELAKEEGAYLEDANLGKASGGAARGKEH
jgi:hypothetical protein